MFLNNSNTIVGQSAPVELAKKSNPILRPYQLSALSLTLAFMVLNSWIANIR